MKRFVNKGLAFFLAALLVITTAIGLVGCSRDAKEASAAESSGASPAGSNTASNPMVGDPSEEYYMVTFVSGIQYWKGCYKGFEDAAKLYGVKTVYEGAPEYDLNKAITVLNQVIAKRPTGIAITCMNPEAYKEPIKEAMNAGIPVVTFDADSPDSGRYSFLATGNYEAGVTAANHMAKLLDQKGDVAVLTCTGQLNHEQRSAGFQDTIKNNYPDMKVVQVGNTAADTAKGAAVAASILQANPDLKGIFDTDASGSAGAASAVKEAQKVGQVKLIAFDSDTGILDAIKEGTVDATIAQGSWNMGFWSLQFLYQLKHNLINPSPDWKAKGINPLPPSVDTGVTIVTKDNVDAFYVE